MLRKYQTIIVGIALLFCAQSAQAVPMAPAADYGFGTIGTGTSVSNTFIVNDDREVAWFSFNLTSTANVSVDTFGSTDDSTPPLSNDLDSLIALYDDGGSLVLDNSGSDQNDDCATSGDFTSCQTFASLAPLTAGLYLIGVTEFSPAGDMIPASVFKDQWTIENRDDTWVANVKVNITVSAVPVPAAIWLFGTALIGFIGMSRRTTVKA